MIGRACRVGGGRAARALMALSLVLGGCLGEPKHPRLQITNASFTGVDLHVRPLQLRLLVDLKVKADNPSRIDLKVRNVRGTVVLGQNHEVPVQVQPDVWLPAEQETLFSVPVAVPVDTAVQLAREALHTDCIAYKIEGEVDLTATSTFQINRDGYPLRKESCISRASLLKAIKL